MTPEELERLREAFAATSPDDRPREDCPQAERIWLAARNELDPGEMRQVVAHVASCPVCTEAWRLAAELEGGTPVEASPAMERSGRYVWRIAAVLVVAVGLGVLLRGRPAEESVTRALDAPALELLSQDSVPPRSACELRWTEIEGATYDVRISLESLEEVSRATGLTAPDFLVPAADLEPIPACTQLLVHIEAHRLGEGRLAGVTARFRCDDPLSDC